MSLLPRMPSISSIVVEPTPGGTYDDWYNTLMVVRSTVNDGKGTASLQFVPYNYDTGEILSDETKALKINVSDFWPF